MNDKNNNDDIEYKFHYKKNVNYLYQNKATFQITTWFEICPWLYKYEPISWFWNPDWILGHHIGYSPGYVKIHHAVRFGQ